ncbi:MAG: GGDEF domain-containing protein [Thermoanaerobaculia bacterium]
MFDQLFSGTALAFEAGGTLLLALALVWASQSSERIYPRLWAAAWGSMFVALLSVHAYLVSDDRMWWLVFLLSEWSFAFLLAAGFSMLVRRRPLPWRKNAALIPLGAALAILMVIVAPGLVRLFAVEAAVAAIAFVWSFRLLGRVAPEERSAGWQMMRSSLAFLAVLFVAYVPLYSIHGTWVRLDFLVWAPVADALGTLLLGFGMILVITEEAKTELRTEVERLRQSHDLLARKALTDPLTGTLNRHALYELTEAEVSSGAGEAGTVVMVDLDFLKEINDLEGHDAGDAAIRSAAQAIRSIIRADDFLFRWGGDEFLAILPGLDAGAAARRFDEINRSLVFPLHPGELRPLHLSWGVAEYGNERSLQDAIIRADADMYRSRGLRR